ncbi:glycine cleavage system protein R [Magnetofaba australis]|uniref:Putative amino acid-binding ACT domain-containing protein n=1 Tax=Magnetofaba australis IT-1 TaxID=1434232 RepID=A0A1Y2K099_9PROT|nr:ACT domain-containing protein [Magnetofaba australis]OSM01450.1 putative amino acid-binding ACT domain-containing protein [Magnetofaba australis IT-1]
MADFALLSLTGADRPGIVARITRVLFDTGCNIEDSSMTRLRGQFTVMLVLRLGDGVDLARLNALFAPIASDMGLNLHTAPIANAAPVAAEHEDGSCCMINVMGADKPGIVYRVTQTLADYAANVVDLETQVGGAPGRPVYGMVIEVESVANPDGLRSALQALAKELDIEIGLRDADVFQL